MVNRWLMGVGSMALVVLIGLATGTTTIAQRPVTPRTPWGHPDLQGVYSNDDETGTPFERPAGLDGRRIEDFTAQELDELNRQRNAQFNAGVAGTEFAGGLRPPTHLIFDSFERRNSRPWLVVDPPDGRVPALTPEGQARSRIRQPSSNANPLGPFDGPEDLGLYDRCITRGIPNSMMPAGYGSWYEILQSPTHVAIRYEMVHETRIVPLIGSSTGPSDGPGANGRLGSNIRLDMGHARGWWEGDTLVVETTNFAGRMSYRGSSEALTLVERFTPIAPDVVDWRVTFNDPRTWTQPWTFAMPLKKQTGRVEVFEYACHEGNHGMRNILSAARATDRSDR